MEYSKHYDRFKRDISYNISVIKEHNILPKNRQANILDLGCASGDYLHAYLRLGYSNVYGVEIDKGLYSTAHSLGLNVVNRDIREYLTCTNEKFDLVLLLDVLEHLPKKDHIDVLKGIYNVLNQNGMLVLITLNAFSPISHAFQNIDWTHQCSFTPTSLAYIIENSGFDNFKFYNHYKIGLRKKILYWWHNKIIENEFQIKNKLLARNILVKIIKS